MYHESELLTDLKVIFYGLKLADEEDIGCIEIESNSITAVNHVLHRQPSFQYPKIVEDILDLMSSPWESCVLKYVPPASNLLVIDLAHYAHYALEGGQISKLWSCPNYGVVLAY